MDRIHTGIRRLEVLPESVELQSLKIGFGRLSGLFTKSIKKRALAGIDDLAMNRQAVGTPEQYYQQAQALAAAAPPADQRDPQQQEWLPLGVFGLTSEDTGDSQAVVQLAVNKQGVIAGTYYNEAGQVSRPIQGTVDLKTQRVAMSFADKKNTDRVLETSINNLTQDEAPALLHFGAEQSQPVLLVRLKQPEETDRRQ